MTNESKTAQSRRDFLKGAALVSTGVALGPVLGNAASDGGEKIAPAQHQTMLDYAAPPIPTVRIGLIGTGARGVTHLRLLAGIPGVSIKAICDTDPISLENAKAAVKKTGIPEPSYHTGNKHAYREMLDGDAIDAVVISTPWRWHAPMCIDAMNAGKHAFVEVPMATTIEDLWEMVEVSERTRMHCMMMENVCYGRDEMMVLNLVRQGLFGELTHGEGAYIHDLRWQMKEIERGTGSWRTHYHTTQRGNIYPTHGLGPIAQYMNINRGDRFDFMTSLSSPALGRSAYAGREFPPGHQRNALKYVKGDMNSTIIKTVKGRSILVQYDTTTARPYNRLNLVQGTNGTFAGFPNRIALESPPKNIHQLYEAEHAQALNEWENGGQQGDQPRIQSFHRWDMDMNKWRMHYDHPFWKKMAAVAEQAGGHGGMDFVMLWRMVQCLQNGLALDQNVYDGAAWSSVFPLSHASVVSRSKSMDFPDFTRGRWKTAKSLDIAA